MFETLLIGGIVAFAAVMGGRSFYRTFKGDGERCACGHDCSACTGRNGRLSGSPSGDPAAPADDKPGYR